MLTDMEKVCSLFREGGNDLCKIVPRSALLHTATLDISFFCGSDCLRLMIGRFRTKLVCSAYHGSPTEKAMAALRIWDYDGRHA